MHRERNSLDCVHTSQLEVPYRKLLQLDRLADWFLQPQGNPSLQALGIWCRSELLGLDSSWSVAPGVIPGHLGSSGIVVRKASRNSLKSSTECFWKFLISFGRELNNLAPETWKVDILLLFLENGTVHIIPFFSLNWTSWIPGLGTSSSTAFRTHMILYLSILLISEFIFNFWSRSQ